jgi:hypothetical protein
MTKRDRNAFARKHATWLAPASGAALALGFVSENPFAVAAGVAGLIWLARAFWVAR